MMDEEDTPMPSGYGKYIFVSEDHVLDNKDYFALVDYVELSGGDGWVAIGEPEKGAVLIYKKGDLFIFK